MYRSRTVKTTSCALLFITFVYAVASACSWDVNDPCTSTPEKVLSRGQLDGIWAVSTIDGQSSSNFPLPFPSTDRFVTGSIDFKTREVQGSCDDLEVSKGYAVANYVLRRSDGTLKPNKRYVGNFRYDHKKKSLKLTAAGYTLNGTVSSNTMTLPAAHPIFGSYVLVLNR